MTVTNKSLFVHCWSNRILWRKKIKLISYNQKMK